MKKLLFLVAILAVASMPFSSAFAGSPLSVGVEAGMVNTEVEAFDNTWMLGAFVDVGLPMLNWYIQPFINYWTWSQDVNVFGTDVESSLDNWTVGGNVKMAIPTASMVRPFIGAGLSAHMLTQEAQSKDDALNVDFSDTKVGFQFGGGVNIDAGESWSIVAQSWYHVVDGFNQWSIRGGLAWSL